MKKVKFVDLSRQHASIKNDIRETALRVIDSGKYIGGEEVSKFEQEMANWLGVDEICGTGCATSALYGVLKCIDVGPGDEVITTVHTAIATAEAISLNGASVVFCDIAEDCYNLDLNDAESKINSKTKAIIPVHLYGQPVDMDKVMAICSKYKLFLLEDCAQAQGASYKGKKVGTFGDAAAFSFFPSKTMGGFGDGGAVTVKDKALMRKVRMFLNHGRESKYFHEFEGTNSRLDTIQAAMLRKCLTQIDIWNEQRRYAASIYDSLLKSIPEVSIPKVLPQTSPVYHVYVITVPDREALIKFLKDNGIETGVHYPYSLNVLPAFERLKQGKGSFPRAEYACEHMLSLPLFPGIEKEEIEYVCEKIKDFFK